MRLKWCVAYTGWFRFEKSIKSLFLSKSLSWSENSFQNFSQFFRPQRILPKIPRHVWFVFLCNNTSRRNWAFPSVLQIFVFLSPVIFFFFNVWPTPISQVGLDFTLSNENYPSIAWVIFCGRHLHRVNQSSCRKHHLNSTTISSR